MTGVLHTVVEVPADLVGASTAFWSAATGWPRLEPQGSVAYLHVAEADGPAGVRLELREVAEPVRWPEPRTWAGGHRSRYRQPCVDVPPGSYDAERERWTEVTGWRPGAGSRPEFDWLHPPHGPQQLLVQRLDTEDGLVRVHLDLGTDDVAAEVARLRDLGARVRPGDDAHTGRWVVLRDPADLPFCVTTQPP